MKVKVNFKKPTVMLTADKYSSMLKEMEDMRHDLALYRGWHAEDQGKILDLITKRDQQAALIQELNDQIEASETARKDAEDALVIAKKNATLREMGWDMLHKQIEELQRENRGLRVDLSNARKFNEELSDQVETDEREIADLKASREVLQGFREELGQEVEEANRTIAEMATELQELKADRNITIAENERLRARMAEKDKTNDIAVRATSELADMVVTARNERDTARIEAEDLRLELMERGCRIEELEKQVEWLRDKNDEWAQVANDQKSTIINYEAVIQSLQEEVERWKRIAAEDVEMAKRFHHEASAAEEEAKRLKDSYDALYEQSASNHANAEYWEDQTHKMEAEVDTLRRQLKANEEEYHNLRKMYIELREAAAIAASHIRSNMVAN